jgi:hypothetical protein
MGLRQLQTLTKSAWTLCSDGEICVSCSQVLSQFGKTNKIASSDVARSRLDWNIFHIMIASG